MTKIAMCSCGAPLVMTFHWAGKEFYCLDCGRLYEYFGPIPAEETPELLERMEAYKIEFSENAGEKLLTPGSTRTDCEKCETEDRNHPVHATDEERAAHEEALKWLKERRRVEKVTI